MSVKLQYDTQIDKVREDIAKILNLPDIKLTPNFAANAIELEKGKADSWKEDLGSELIRIWTDMGEQLKDLKFHEDDMLQEGFAEGVPEKEIIVKVVEKSEKGGYNDLILRDGKMFIEYTPGYWRTSSRSSVGGIIDIL